MPAPETNEPTTNQTAPDNPEAAASGSDQAGQDGGAGLTAQLEAAKAEAAANYDKFVRTAADLENYRRRVQRDKDELRTIATGRVMEDIFPVLDTLGLAINAAR